ncbi:MAG: 50S ribosomal protein L25 [Myxococcota bacterium]|nr:50S ribosomal protein L25 [Myxococcota bacterium]
MAENTLIAEQRSETGKGIARRLRAEGRIPAVLYGRGVEAQSLSVDSRALDQLLRASGAGRNTLIDLQVEGKGNLVLVKDIHREPVRGGFMHADFYAIDRDQRVEVKVPLHFVGKAPGMDFGGILDHPVRELDITCLVTAIPESIDADMSPLNLGDALHVRDVPVPDGVEVVTDGDLTVAICVAPRAVEEEAPEEVAAEGEGEAAPAEAPAEGDAS